MRIYKLIWYGLSVIFTLNIWTQILFLLGLKTLTFKALCKFVADHILTLILLFFRENKTWNFMWIITIHMKSQANLCKTLFSLKKKIKKIKVSSAAGVISILRVRSTSIWIFKWSLTVIKDLKSSLWKLSTPPIPISLWFMPKYTDLNVAQDWISIFYPEPELELKKKTIISATPSLWKYQGNKTIQ